MHPRKKRVFLRFTLRPSHTEIEEEIKQLSPPLSDEPVQISAAPIVLDDTASPAESASALGLPALADRQADDRQRAFEEHIDDDPHPDVLPR